MPATHKFTIGDKCSGKYHDVPFTGTTNDAFMVDSTPWVFINLDKPIYVYGSERVQLLLRTAGPEVRPDTFVQHN